MTVESKFLDSCEESRVSQIAPQSQKIFINRLRLLAGEGLFEALVRAMGISNYRSEVFRDSFLRVTPVSEREQRPATIPFLVRAAALSRNAREVSDATKMQLTQKTNI
jgi:hypothetical protein